MKSVYDLDAFVTFLEREEKRLRVEEGYFAILPCLNSLEDMSQVKRVAEASDRILALVVDQDDQAQPNFCSEKLKVEAVKWAAARGQLVLGPRYCGENIRGYMREAELEKALGMSGKMAVTEAQATAATECFSVMTEDLEQAWSVLDGGGAGTKAEERARSLVERQARELDVDYKRRERPNFVSLHRAGKSFNEDIKVNEFKHGMILLRVRGIPG